MIKRFSTGLLAMTLLVVLIFSGCGKTSGNTSGNTSGKTSGSSESKITESEITESGTTESGTVENGAIESGIVEGETAAAGASLGSSEEKPEPSGDGDTKTAGAEAAGAETAGTEASEPAGAYDEAKEAALAALSLRMSEEREAVYVYKDFGLTENHFTQKAKMAGIDGELVRDMDENWQENPYSGSSCIRCEQGTRDGDWGGWLFLNGYLPAGESVPHLNDGSMDGQGLDLEGAEELRFFAKGEKGGETVEFFTCGFGYDGVSNAKTVQYPDSATKRSLGPVELTDEWQEYVIPLDDADLSYIVCGFGYVLNDVMDGNAENVFFLDEIRFTGEIGSAQAAPVMLRSYDTENIYIKNAAFSYDNALVAMAFLSDGRTDEAKKILDAFVYAVNNDRARETELRRVRNAYAAGDILAWPGWESGARLPGWYDNESGEWYEDRYQVGSNVGNTSYVALALLQYYHVCGGEEYLETARSLMDWVIGTCSGGGDGFTGGFDGWEEGEPPVVYPFTYKSIEHNIDAYAAFDALYSATGEDRYNDAAQSARRFIESMYDEEQGLFMTGTLEDGMFPAATVDNLSTGMDLFDGSPWEYSTDPHIAPAAWFVMAANGFNPYVAGGDM